VALLSPSASSVPIPLGGRTYLPTCLLLLLRVQPLQQSILGSGVTHVISVVRAAGTSVGHLVQCVLFCSISDVEVVLCTLSLHLPVVYTAFLLYIPPSSCYHRETTTYREVPSTISTPHPHHTDSLQCPLSSAYRGSDSTCNT
jgi:hypothetical protein